MLELHCDTAWYREGSTAQTHPNLLHEDWDPAVSGQPLL